MDEPEGVNESSVEFLRVIPICANDPVVSRVVALGDVPGWPERSMQRQEIG